MRALHEAGAWVVVVANGLAGLWALGALRWSRLQTRQLWRFTGAAQLALFAEVAAGVWLTAVGGVGAPRLHTFYGFLGPIAVAVIYSYRQQLRDRLYLLYGLGGLFVTGLAIRAMVLR